MAYRTDNVPLSCFENDLSFSLTSAMSLNIPIFILADFNCNMLRPDEKEANALHDLCDCFNLSQVINKPTRTTQFSKSLIDVIITNNSNLIKETQVIPHSISDHDLIVATLQLKKPRPKPFTSKQGASRTTTKTPSSRIFLMLPGPF